VGRLPRHRPRVSTPERIEGSITKAAQGCADWQRTWAAEVRQSNPDVVAVELGRWEVSDRIVGGSWTRIGARPWDDLLSRLLNQAIAVVSQRGAKVVLFTLPYIQQTTEQPNGERVRNADDEHPSIAGGELLRPIILPRLLALGSSHRRELAPSA
jgi:hypothetical protein